MNNHPAKSKHEREHAAMLGEALSRPSVRQVMEVYRNWQRADRALQHIASLLGKVKGWRQTDDLEGGI